MNSSLLTTHHARFPLVLMLLAAALPQGSLPVPRSPAEFATSALPVPTPVRSTAPALAPFGVGRTGPTPPPSPAALHPPWRPPFGNPLLIIGPYRAPPTPYTSGHRGVDLPAVPGSVVRAPASGTVTFRGLVVDRETVTVRVDPDTVYSVEPVSSTLAVGAAVAADGVLGTVSAGGHCEAECAHLGVRLREEYVSPLRYLLGSPVLQPW